MSNKIVTQNMKTAMRRAAFLLKVLDLEIDAETTNKDLCLMAQRIDKESRDEGFEPARDTFEFLCELRAESQAKAFTAMGGDA